MQKKIRFIVNPYSGTKNKNEIVSFIREVCSKTNFYYEIKFTKYKGHATELTKEAVENYFYAVVAVGGDGSVNEVAKGLVNSETALGIIPAGSGNGMARHLGVPIHYREAVSFLIQTEVNKIDTAMFNHYFFAGMAGIGFEALVAWKFATSKKRGLATYIKMIGQEWFRYKPLKVFVKTENETYQGEVFSLAIANGSQYGNNVVVSPLSLINDGLLEVVIIQKVKGSSIPGLLLAMFRKKINKHKQVKTIRAKEITIEHQSSIAHVDGEPVKVNGHIHVRVYPKSLNVICNKL
ncbi:MAG: diacylglycerol kinase family lipid kinase [Flavobacteriales bacterium]|nr:diacylglycerol kinase family lipid kinase [Flavobacteriales bacterium]